MNIFPYLSLIEQFFSTYIGFALVCISGLYLTFYSRGFQFKTIKDIRKNLAILLQASKQKTDIGINPFKLYFASVGGMIGIGNIVGVGSAVFVGGPGSIFWMWVASFLGMLVKYSEIYLGVKYRVVNSRGGYDGGPMYFLPRAFSGKLGAYLSKLSAALLCIYGIEIYQFSVIVDNLGISLPIDKAVIIVCFILMIFYAGLGGLNRVANVCSVMMPVFMISYVLLCLFIIFSHWQILPQVFSSIITSAFSGHAAIGGFIGSSILLCGYQGTSSAIYAGDIGIGYDAVIQSETKIDDPKKQAQLSIYALLTDTFICSMTTLVIVVTGAWHKFIDISQSQVMAEILKNYIPFSNIFMTVVLFLAGYTTITAFFAVGLKNARFLSPRYGTAAFVLISIISFSFFSYVELSNARTVMLISGMLLVLINLIAILKLRKQIDFDYD